MSLLLVSLVSSLYIKDSERVNFGNYIRVINVSMSPEELAPGKQGIIKFSLINNGVGNVDNIRVKLELPSGLSFYEDVDTVKLSRLSSMSSREFAFKIIASPTALEGIHNANLTVYYTSYFGADFANVGEEQQDVFKLGIIVKGEPNIFVGVDETKVYKGKNIGEVTFKFVNNDAADVKFLIVELEDTDDYDIISNPKEYIGDLDSDDYESVDFRVKMKKKSGEIVFPLQVNYKDSMNNDYEDRFEVGMKMFSAKDLGVEKNNTNLYLIISIVMIIAGWIGYKKYKSYKRKKRFERNNK